MPPVWTRIAAGVGSLVLAWTAVASAIRLQDNLFAAKAVDPEHVWAVGNFGSIAVTKDAGRTWSARQSGTKQPLFSVDFADPLHGWVVGETGLILHTSDGGATWTPQTSPIESGKHLFTVDAIDRQTVWAVGDWGAIVTTRDGGATWLDRSLGVLTVEQAESPHRALQVVTDDVILYDVAFVDARHGAIAGEFGTVMVTRDGGATWARTNTGTDKTFFGVHFTTPRTGWVVGIDGLVLRTTDGGESWEVQRGIVERSDIGELSFIEAMENPGLYAVAVMGDVGVIVGDTGALLVSQDGGATWEHWLLPGRDRLVWMRDVSLAPGPGGLLVGAGGFTATVDGATVLARGQAPATKAP